MTLTASNRTDVGYTVEDKIRAASCYLSMGTIGKAATMFGCSKATFQSWMESEWWPEAMTLALGLQQKELDAGFSEIIALCTQELKDRLTHGDVTKVVKVEQEDGSVVEVVHRKPIGGKDLAIIKAIAVDKRQLGRNLPTSITGRIGARAQNVAERLRAHTKSPAPAEVVKDAGCDPVVPGVETLQ